MTYLPRLLGCSTLASLLLLPALAVARQDDDKKDEKVDKAEARRIADRELLDMAVRHVVSRLQATKTDGFSFLEENVGFSPTAADFPLEIHSYADLPDAVRAMVRRREPVVARESDRETYAQIYRRWRRLYDDTADLGAP